MKLFKFTLALAAVLAAGAASAQQSFNCLDNGRKAERVIGGKAVSYRDAPFQVALFRNGRFVCGGSLISRRWVLTAAHCMFTRSGQRIPDSAFEVGYGTDNRDTMRRMNIEKAYIHRSYNKQTLDNDITLLRLPRLADVPRSAIVRIAVQSSERRMAQAEACARVTGYGATSNDFSKDTSSKYLQGVYVKVRSQSECKNAMSKFGPVTRNMMCAGFTGGVYDSCSGDSGGPLVVRGSGHENLQVGIVSWGSPNCAQQSTFGVYTRVANYKPWIDQITGKY